MPEASAGAAISLPLRSRVTDHAAAAQLGEGGGHGGGREVELGGEGAHRGQPVSRAPPSGDHVGLHLGCELLRALRPPAATLC
ncbi:MAG: hypothetical protein R2746_15060 [Acidimicrobiales bacterium]